MYCRKIYNVYTVFNGITRLIGVLALQELLEDFKRVWVFHPLSFEYYNLSFELEFVKDIFSFLMSPAIIELECWACFVNWMRNCIWNWQVRSCTSDLTWRSSSSSLNSALINSGGILSAYLPPFSGGGIIYSVNFIC